MAFLIGYIIWHIISLPKKKNWNVFYIDMVLKKFVGIWWAKDHMSFFIFVKIEIQKGCLWLGSTTTNVMLFDKCVLKHDIVQFVD